jgi:hypothetical protein
MDYDPYGVLFMPSGRFAFVTTEQGLFVVDVKEKVVARFIGDVSPGVGFHTVSIMPDCSRIFVCNQDANSIAVFGFTAE